MANVVAFEPARRTVVLADGETTYDALIVALGSQYNYFGHPWEHLAPSLKSVEDATEIRRRILLAFERAERTATAEERRRLLTFVIVGGGPTGVELAGALAEIARHSSAVFRQVRPSDARIILLEAQDRVLSGLVAELSEKAQRSLERLGVEVRTHCLVTDITPSEVQFQAEHKHHSVLARTVFWTAGVRAPCLAQQLADATGARQDRVGRIVVEPDLSLAGHPDIFVVGDLAHCAGKNGDPLPGLAPVAIQQGRHAAKMIIRRIAGKPTTPFRYRDYGTMATIGRSLAVADFHWFRLSGFLAWIAWLFVHLMQIVTFQNRILVLIQWAWHYITFSRNAQLITFPHSADSPPACDEDEKSSTGGH